MTKTKQYCTPQDKCPACGEPENIANEDAAEDKRLHVTCHTCTYQWVEPESEDTHGCM